jgi:hypothetical protein
MVKKKVCRPLLCACAVLTRQVDARVKTLIENCVRGGHRALVVLVGDRAQEQVATLHYVMSKASVRPKPNVLWCYKSDLAFSASARKRKKASARKASRGLIDPAGVRARDACSTPVSTPVSGCVGSCCGGVGSYSLRRRSFRAVCLQHTDLLHVLPRYVPSAWADIRHAGVAGLRGQSLCLAHSEDLCFC